MADLRAWRLSREAELELPSGLTVRVRRVPLVDLAAGGQIPAPLAETVNRLIKAGPGGIVIDLSTLTELAPVLDVVTRAALVEPPLSDVADDEHVTLAEISLDDKLEIFRWANTAAKELEPFRGEPGGDVDPAQPG
jgi:hypothetical protein